MNRSISRVTCVILCVGCSKGVPDDAEGSNVDSTVARVTKVEMPAYPDADPGQVAVVMSHRDSKYVVSTAWEAQAGRCEGTNMLQIVASTDSYGVAVLMRPDVADSQTATMPILTPSDSTPPEVSARVVIQVYPEDRAFILKGIDGNVEIDDVSATLSGRFSGRLVESTYRDTVFAAGSFNALRVETVPEEYCRPAGSSVVAYPEDLEPKPVLGGRRPNNG